MLILLLCLMYIMSVDVEGKINLSSFSHSTVLWCWCRCFYCINMNVCKYLVRESNQIFFSAVREQPASQSNVSFIADQARRGIPAVFITFPMPGPHFFKQEKQLRTSNSQDDNSAAACVITRSLPPFVKAPNCISSNNSLSQGKLTLLSAVDRKRQTNRTDR